MTFDSIPFRPISICDKELICGYTRQSDYRNCAFSFANICSWNFLYQTEYAVVDRMLLIRFRIDEGRIAYMMPSGDGDLRQAIRRIESDAESLGHTLCLLGVSAHSCGVLEQLFPGEFKFHAERDYFDYIYLRANLLNLTGKKFQSKRNHINRFIQTYPDYRYTPITSDIIPVCLDLEDRWREEIEDPNEQEAIDNERKSMIFALNHYEELGISGGALWVDDRIVAFTFGAPINYDTFGVHVEKADSKIDGAYTMINKLFVGHIPDTYTYINREEDLGLPGLRKAKLSYHPDILLEKYSAIKYRE